MPWGDECVEQLAQQVRAQWAEARRDGQSQAPPLPAQVASSPSTSRSVSRAGFAVAAACGMLLGAAGVLGAQVLAPSPRHMTGICQDGSATFARSERGACSNHGGVREFSK